MDEEGLSVMKFGGSSVGTPDRFHKIGDIVSKVPRATSLVVVVSALSSVTRELDAAYHKAASGIFPDNSIQKIRRRHVEHAQAVLTKEGARSYRGYVREILNHLSARLKTVRQSGGTAKARDDVLACGERLSVPLVTLSLKERGLLSVPTDAKRLIATDDEFGSAEVLLEPTKERVSSWYGALSSQAIPVTAGFIGSTLAGETTTLGFEGSDYTASILASILGASNLTRWTDVDGVYTADPHSNPDATRIEQINMNEAIQRNEEGKMGMHRKALAPLASTSISVHIRCIDTPDQPGTKIVSRRRQSSS